MTTKTVSNMAVFRVHKTGNYTVMSNHHLQDKDLSLSAKGLLSVILSLPPDWKYSINGLVQISKEGDKAIKSTLDELKKHGYLTVRRINPEHGHNRVRYEYDVYEEPYVFSQTAKPQVAEPCPSEGVQREVVQAEGVPEGGQLNTYEVSTNYQVHNIYTPQKKAARKQKPFVPPTIEEIQAYVTEKGYHFDPQAFFDYYTASDWHFANGKPVKSWKQCCVTWESNHKYDKPAPRRIQQQDMDSLMSDWQVEHWSDANGS